MSALRKRFADLAQAAPREYDVDDADVLGDGTGALLDGGGGGGAVSEADLVMGAPQYRGDIDMGDDPRYQGVRTSRREMRRQRGEGYSDDSGGGDSSSGVEEYDEDMALVDSDDDGGDDDDGGAALGGRVETEDIEAELEALESNDQQMLMKQPAESSEERAAHTKNQIELYERTLEGRIRLQKAVAMAHRLPRQPARRAFHRRSPKAQAGFAAASASVSDLLDSLHDMHRELARQSSCFSGVAWDSSDEEDDEEDSVERHWRRISSAWNAVEPTMVDVVAEWQRKLLFQSGMSAKKQLKVVNQDIRKQTDAVLENRATLVRRSQVTRTPDSREMGSSLPKGDDGSGSAPRDPHTYDDPDFYHQLLNEFIKTRKTVDGFAVGTVRKKSRRKKVDRRASKGRKLRFKPHPKLVNFMAPKAAPAPPMDLDSLHASLFASNS